MNYRAQKRIIIALATFVVVAIFAWGGFGLWLLIRSQDREIPVSNGGSGEVKLEPIEVVFEEFFEIDKGLYDVIAFLKNPNSEYGASQISYEFVLSDTSGELYRGVGETFILPNQSRYVVLPVIRTTGSVDKLAFYIRNVTWERLHPFSSLGLSVTDTILSRNDVDVRTIFSGIVKNRSPYNLQNIEVQVVLFDEVGVVFAAGVTDMQTLLRGTDRFFQITWPYLLPPENTMDIRVESNFLKNSNFIREYGTPQKFQEYY